MSQTDRVFDVLSDGEWHTIQEIHSIVGPCRLNSRISELRDPRKKWKRDVKCHRESVRNRFGQPETIWRYRDFGPLDSETAAAPLGAGQGAVSESSAADERNETSSPGSFVGPSLDEYGVDLAAADENAKWPDMLQVDGVTVSATLPIEEQRAELAKLQQTLFGKAA